MVETSQTKRKSGVFLSIVNSLYLSNLAVSQERHDFPAAIGINKSLYNITISLMSYDLDVS